MNEDWDAMAMAEPLAGEELERMLARYARVRLDPSGAQAKRARSAVMEQAWRRRIEATRQVARPPRRLPFGSWSPRRMGVSLSAAVFAGLMLGSTVFAGSRAGGPLYEPRLAIEGLALPTDPGARADAQVQAAQVRLSEAMEASGRHDDGATVAALAAYDRTLHELQAATGPAADRALVAIQFHHGVLTQIAETAPVAAADGLERALANNERLMERLTAAGTGPGSGNGGPNGPGNGPGTNNGHGNGPGTNNGVGPGAGPGVGPGGGGPSAGPAVEATPEPGTPTDDPEATPVPTDEPKPTKEPRPTKEPKPTVEPDPTDDPQPAATPSPTERPGKTPKPRPSHGGGERERPSQRGNPRD